MIKANHANHIDTDIPISIPSYFQSPTYTPVKFVCPFYRARKAARKPTRPTAEAPIWRAAALDLLVEEEEEEDAVLVPELPELPEAELPEPEEPEPEPELEPEPEPVAVPVALAPGGAPVLV
jgi:hypothetical protein